jgi:tRNA nucleotidyltransferase (CCA-adding enzyme)
MRLRSHDRFGTLSLEGPEGAIDLATVRRESYPHAGALPVTEPGTLEEDLRRRDFSVNALALALSRVARARHLGEIVVEGGLGDLGAPARAAPVLPTIHASPQRGAAGARLASR